MDSSILVWLGQNLWVVNAAGLALDGVGFSFLAADLVPTYRANKAAAIFARRGEWLKTYFNERGVALTNASDEQREKWEEFKRGRTVGRELEKATFRLFSGEFSERNQRVLVNDVRRIIRRLPMAHSQSKRLQAASLRLSPNPDLLEVMELWQYALEAVREALEPYTFQPRKLVFWGITLVLLGFLLQFIGTVAAGIFS